MYKTYYFLASGTPGDPFARAGAGAASQADALLPRAAGVTQSRPSSAQIDPGGSSPFAGILEVWHFRPEDALDESEPARVAGLLAPGARIACSHRGLARTVMRLPAHLGASGVKCVFPFRRKPGMTVDAFRRRWWHGHGPIAARTEHALFYLQCHPLDEAYADGAEPRFDGVTELHFASLALARAAMASEQMRVEQGSDAPHFAAAGSVLLFAATEEILRAP
jgi:hypothetical protein